MPQDYTWLSISLFCEKQRWNNLLNDSIYLFLKSNQFCSILTAYTLEFNYEGGSNIRVALLMNNAYIEEFLPKIDAYFKKYYASIKVNENNNNIYPNRIFQPYPPDSIQYGLYKPIVVANRDLDKFNLPIALSKIIIEALKDESFDDETILTFGIYLNVGLIKAIMQLKPLLIHKLLTSYSLNYYNDIVDEDFSDTINKNKNTVFEIVEDILGSDASRVPFWAETWIKICKVELEKESALLSKEDNYISKHKTISYFIHKYLGLNKNESLLLSFFTFKALEFIECH